MIYPSKDDIEDLIKEGTYLVDFYADWCGPCKMMEPILEDISSDINIIKVNTDEMPKTTFKYRIMSIPTLIIFRDGNEVVSELGDIGYDGLKKLLKNNGVI